MATPVESQGRDYEVFLRGPVPNMQFCFGSLDEYRGGLWHKGRLVEFPAPTDNEVNDFGIQTGGGFDVVILDEMDDLDWPIEDENYDPILDESGDPLITEY